MQKGVNSRRFFGFALATAVSWGTPAEALEQGAIEQPILLGGPQNAPPKGPPPLDPRLPTGAEIVLLERPAQHEPPACSSRRPVCVHRGERVSAERALAALGAFESAYERLVLSLGLPEPLGDQGQGGTDALDLYLRAGSGALRVGYEPVPEAFDQGAGFCVLGEAESSLVDRAASQCVGEAIALRLDPAETPHIRRAYATHLWLIAGRPTSFDFRAIDDFQVNPEEPVFTRELTTLSEGAALFLEYLDAARGVGAPGALATGLFSLSASQVRASAGLWNNEPDLVDVLRQSLGGERAEFAALLSGFGVARAFTGNRSDGTHLPSADWTGAFGNVRFDWSLKFSTLPRRVLSTRPIYPTGMVYLWLELDDVPLGAALYMNAEWEHPVPFKWVIVRVDKDGAELSRVDVPYQESGTSAEQRVVDLEVAAGLLIVGVNIGDISAAFPFDPDIVPFEPQRCTVHLARL